MWVLQEINKVAILFFVNRSDQRGISGNKACEILDRLPPQTDWVGSSDIIMGRVLTQYRAGGYAHMVHDFAKASAMSKPTADTCTKKVPHNMNTNAIQCLGSPNLTS